MANLALTDGSLLLPRRPAAQVRKIVQFLTELGDQRQFCEAVASMHPYAGDALGPQAARLKDALAELHALATELQAALPAPYTPPPPREYAEPLPRPARESEQRADYEWWTTKDKPERVQ